MKIKLTLLVLTVSVLYLNAQIYTPAGTIQGTTGNNYMGIGTNAPKHKLEVYGSHVDSRILLHSNGRTNDAEQADLMLWASEPGLTYTGVGIGNNINNYTTTGGLLKLLNTARGGSYIRLLDNAMLFNVVSLSGVDKQALSINANGYIGIGTSSPIYKFHIVDTDGGVFFDGANANYNRFKSTAVAPITGKDLLFSAQSAGITPDLYITSALGYIGIGTTIPDEKLTVNGTIHATEVKVTSTVPVPDYVFSNDYKLKTLQDVEAYIKQNSHLPEIPSAIEIEKNGLMLAEMNMALLKKMEEMTLYMIEQNKELKMQKTQLQLQNDKIILLENKIESNELNITRN